MHKFVKVLQPSQVCLWASTVLLDVIPQRVLARVLEGKVFREVPVAPSIRQAFLQLTQQVLSRYPLVLQRGGGKHELATHKAKEERVDAALVPAHGIVHCEMAIF